MKKSWKILHFALSNGALWICILLCFGLGCVSARSDKSMRFQVVPVGSQEVAALSSDDIVRVMRRAGFSDEQILQLGTQLRNALLLSGAAQVIRANIVEAIFAIHNNNVYITARLRGNFIYDLQKGSWVRFGRSTPSQSSAGRRTAQPKRPPAAAFPGEYPRSTLQNLRDRQTQKPDSWRR